MKSKRLSAVLLFIGLMLLVGLMQPVMGCSQPIFSPAGQQSDTFVSAILDTPVELRPNQIAQFESEQLNVAFINVSADSRCPADVSCIQAGQVTTVFELWAQGQDSQKTSIYLTLRAAQSDLAIQQIENYTVELLEVEPYPQTTQAIKPEDYRVKVVVSQG